MTDPTVSESQDLVGVVEQANDYFEEFRPETRSVRYNYREKTSEMKMLIEVPEARRNQLEDIEIPLTGYRLKEMFSLPDFKPVKSGIIKNDGCITFDSKDLPAHNEFLINLIGDVEPDTLDHLVSLKVPEDPQSKDDIEEYWVQSAIKQPSIMKEVYDDLEIENIDISVNVGVQRCFSNAIPDDVRDLFDKTMELMSASEDYDRDQLRVAGKRRHEALQNIDTDPNDAADFLRSLATAKHMGDYISVDSPFRRRNINPMSPENNIFPETIAVDITTDLDLDKMAADGNLKFEKEDYQNYIEGEISNELS